MPVAELGNALHPPGTTVADYAALVAMLANALADAVPTDELARRVREDAPQFGHLGLILDVVLGANLSLLALITILMDVAAYLLDLEPDAPPAPAPATGVPVGKAPDRGEVQRIVEARLRQLSRSDPSPSSPQCPDGRPGSAPRPDRS